MGLLMPICCHLEGQGHFVLPRMAGGSGITSCGLDGWASWFDLPGWASRRECQPAISRSSFIRRCDDLKSLSAT
jgi:hypothetical protein